MKYKYKILILDINKDNLYDELNKYGAGGYKIINIRPIPNTFISYWEKGEVVPKGERESKVEYILMKEYKDRKHLKK